MDFPIRKFTEIYDTLVKNPEYKEEISWQDSLKPCNDANEFAMQAIWVIVNSGMKNQIAKKIFDRIMQAGIDEPPTPIENVFGHKGKVRAIKLILDKRHQFFGEYLNAEADDHKQGLYSVECRIEYLKGLPYIGIITSWHLAKNLGVDCVKPDRHLVRVANEYQTTPEALCAQIGRELAMKVSVVDIIIWRACNLGLL